MTVPEFTFEKIGEIYGEDSITLIFKSNIVPCFSTVIVCGNGKHTLARLIEKSLPTMAKEAYEKGRLC